MLCDFCSALNPCWRYPARSFIAFRERGLVGESVGEWWACDACREAIEAGDREGLARRTLAILPMSNELVWDFVRDVHDRFLAARTGPAVVSIPGREG